jgi:uncharacterized protein (TIGR03083 family)
MPTNAPTARTIVLSALYRQWEELGGLLFELSERQWQAPTALPGWSTHAVAAHVIGNESSLAGIAAPEVDIDTRAIAHVRNGIGAANERWVAGLAGVPGPRLAQRFADLTAARKPVLEAMSDQDFEAVTATPSGPGSYLRFLRVCLFDYWVHELDIRDAICMPRDESGDHARAAFSEIVDALGFVVGKKIGAPKGSSVVFDLTGPMAQRICVDVADRARVVPDLAGAPTTSLTLDSRLFTRLACGRVSAADHRTEISIAGDAELGGRVAENLAFAP